MCYGLLKPPRNSARQLGVGLSRVNDEAILICTAHKARGRGHGTAGNSWACTPDAQSSRGVFLVTATVVGFKHGFSELDQRVRDQADVVASGWGCYAMQCSVMYRSRLGAWIEVVPTCIEDVRFWNDVVLRWRACRFGWRWGTPTKPPWCLSTSPCHHRSISHDLGS